jgi:hypothetical protein
MTVCYALPTRGRLRKVLYEFNLVKSDLRTGFRNLRGIKIAWHS